MEALQNLHTRNLMFLLFEYSKSTLLSHSKSQYYRILSRQALKRIYTLCTMSKVQLSLVPCVQPKSESSLKFEEWKGKWHHSLYTWMPVLPIYSMTSLCSSIVASKCTGVHLVIATMYLTVDVSYIGYIPCLPTSFPCTASLPTF